MNNIFTFPINSKHKLVVIGIEKLENKSPSYRILARATEDVDLKEVYVFYSDDKTTNNLKFIRKFI